jgi:hypothetical protein
MVLEQESAVRLNLDAYHQTIICLYIGQQHFLSSSWSPKKSLLCFYLLYPQLDKNLMDCI